MDKATPQKDSVRSNQKPAAGSAGKDAGMESSSHAGASTANPITAPMSSMAGNQAASFASTLPMPTAASSGAVVQRVGISEYFRNNHMANSEESAIKNAGWHNGAWCTSVEANAANSQKISAVKGGKNEEVTLPGLSYWKANKAKKTAEKIDSGNIGAKTDDKKEVFHISSS